MPNDLTAQHSPPPSPPETPTPQYVWRGWMTDYDIREFEQSRGALVFASEQGAINAVAPHAIAFPVAVVRLNEEGSVPVELRETMARALHNAMTADAERWTDRCEPFDKADWFVTIDAILSAMLQPAEGLRA